MSFESNKRKVEKLYNIVKSNEYTIDGLHKDVIQFNSRAFQKSHVTLPLEWIQHPIQPDENIFAESGFKEQLYFQYIFDNLLEEQIPFVDISLIVEKDPSWAISNPEHMDLDNVSMPFIFYTFNYIWKIADKVDNTGSIIGNVHILDLYLLYPTSGYEGGKLNLNLQLNFLNELTYNEIPNHKEKD